MLQLEANLATLEKVQARIRDLKTSIASSASGTTVAPRPRRRPPNPWKSQSFRKSRVRRMVG